MGSFFTALVGSYADTTRAREQAEQKREDDAKQAEVKALGVAMDSGRLSDEGYEAAINRIEELSGTKSKGDKQSMLRTVLTRLRGQVPQNQRYQGAGTLDQQVAASPKAQLSASATQAQGEPLPMQQPGGKQVTPTGFSQQNAQPRAFLTEQQIADRKNVIARKEAMAQIDADVAIYKRINQIASQFTDPEARRSFLYWAKALPPEQRQKVTFKPGIDATSNHQIMHVFDETGNEINSFDMGLPANSKPQKVKVAMPDGTVTDAWDNPGGTFTDQESGGKPLIGAKRIGDDEAKLLEQKQAYADMLLSSGKAKTREQANQMASDLMLQQERKKGEEKDASQPTAAQRMTAFNQTMATFRAQETQAQTALNQAKSQKTQHPIYTRLGLTGTDVAEAQNQADRTRKAIAYLLANKQAVLDGKVDAQDVSDRAQAIMDGADGGPASPDKPTNPAKPSYKAGDTVMYNGRPRKVKAVRPDGKLVLED
jgi:hypothetical protein